MLNKQHNSSLITLALLLTFVGTPSRASQTRFLAQSNPSQSFFSVPDLLREGTQVNIVGSNSTVEMSESLKQSFEQEFPNTQVDVDFQDPVQALRKLEDGTADLAVIDRFLTSKEKAEGFVAVSLGKEKIALLVYKDNPTEAAKAFLGFLPTSAAEEGVRAKIAIPSAVETSLIASSTNTKAKAVMAVNSQVDSNLLSGTEPELIAKSEVIAPDSKEVELENASDLNIIADAEDNEAVVDDKNNKKYLWLLSLLLIPLAWFAFGRRSKSDREPALDSNNIPNTYDPTGTGGRTDLSAPPDRNSFMPNFDTSGNANRVASDATSTADGVTFAAGAAMAGGAVAATNLAEDTKQTETEAQFQDSSEQITDLQGETANDFEEITLDEYSDDDSGETITEIPSNPVNEFTEQATSLQTNDTDTVEDISSSEDLVQTYGSPDLQDNVSPAGSAAIDGGLAAGVSSLFDAPKEQSEEEETTDFNVQSANWQTSEQSTRLQTEDITLEDESKSQEIPVEDESDEAVGVFADDFRLREETTVEDEYDREAVDIFEGDFVLREETDELTEDYNTAIEDLPENLSDTEIKSAIGDRTSADIVDNDRALELENITVDETDTENLSDRTDSLGEEVAFSSIDDTDTAANLSSSTQEQAKANRETSELTFDEDATEFGEQTTDVTEDIGDPSSALQDNDFQSEVATNFIDDTQQQSEITFTESEDNSLAELVDETETDDDNLDVSLEEITFDESEDNSLAELVGETETDDDNLDVSLEEITFDESEDNSLAELADDTNTKSQDLLANSDDMDNISEWLDSLETSENDSDDISEWLDSLNSDNHYASNVAFANDVTGKTLNLADENQSNKDIEFEEELDDVSFQFLEDLLERDSNASSEEK